MRDEQFGDPLIHCVDNKTRIVIDTIKARVCYMAKLKMLGKE